MAWGVKMPLNNLRPSKRITMEQVKEQAKNLGVEYAALMAIITVECQGSGFDNLGRPTILFERHVMYKRLVANGKRAQAISLSRQYPNLCNTSSGGYGPYSRQHFRLEKACSFDRTSALESASWGIGQVMGYLWKELGYSSLQSFINAMYKDEASQLDAMCRYLKVRKVIARMKVLDWDGVAELYNGRGYKKNNYSVKLNNAYRGFKVG